MATKKIGGSSSNNSKGVALLKRAKIDSAQKNMLVAVCLASVVLGITVVGVVYLMKKIQFNVTKMDSNSKEIANFKQTQENLNSLSAGVSGLASDERLEVVANDRSDTKCDSTMLKNMQSEDGLYSLDNIEVVRTCSALRAIADTLPSQRNQEASNSSLNWLIIHNGDIKLQGLTNSESIDSGSILDDSGNPLNLGTLGASVNIKDKPTAINRAIMAIESSIRNFDITSVNISWSDFTRGKSDSEIDFSAVYRSYYSDQVGVQSGKNIICADSTSDGCKKKQGSSVAR